MADFEYDPNRLYSTRIFLASNRGCFHCSMTTHYSVDCPNRGRRAPFGSARVSRSPPPSKEAAEECEDDAADAADAADVADAGDGEALVAPVRTGRSAFASRCYNCGRVGHISRDCRSNPGPKPSFQSSSGRFNNDNARACYNCGQAGHFSRECPNIERINRPRFDSRRPLPMPVRGGVAGRFKANNGGLIICYKCGGQGHVGRDCTEPYQPSQPRNQICFKCQQPGHIKINCPN